jgi:hypothetical protein
MNTTKKLGLLLLALSFSNAALAVKIDKPIPTPIPIPTPTPPPVIPGLAPALMPFQPAGGTTFATFLINAKKAGSTTIKELVKLTGQLKPFGLSPCLVAADLNATPITCGNGLVKFGTNELYTYGRPFNLQKVRVKLNKGVSQPFAANFRSSVGLIPGDNVGRTVHVHFNEPVAQFAMNLDSGQLSAPSIDSVKFVVGLAPDQVELTQFLQPGTQWAGVQLPSGFTDLAIIPQADPLNPTTNALGFATDQFSLVTAAQFNP